MQNSNTTDVFFYFILYLRVMLTVSHVHLHSYQFLLIKARLIVLKTKLDFSSVIMLLLSKPSLLWIIHSTDTVNYDWKCLFQNKNLSTWSWWVRVVLYLVYVGLVLLSACLTIIIFLVFCVVLLRVFAFGVHCCELRYDFRMKTMFGSSLPPIVCRMPHVLLTLFVYAYA